MVLDFHGLPAEVRHMIRDAIPSSDLRTHVCLCISTPQNAALYEQRYVSDVFWETACWECGIGLLPDEDPDEIDWQQIAIECIVRDGFCQHAQCGEALLEYNREQIQESEEYVKPLQPLHLNNGGVFLPHSSHQVFGHIRFRGSNEAGILNRYPLEDDAYLPLHVSASGVDVATGRSFLRQHPLIARSFATSIPVSTFNLLGVAGPFPRPHKLALSRTVTVWDVLQIIHRGLDEDITVREAAEYVCYHEECLRNKGWDYASLFSKLRTVREIMSVCPIKYLEHEDTAERGPSPTFSIELH